MTSVKKLTFLTLILAILFTSFTSARRCQSRKQNRVLPLASVHIVDRNGFVETITNKDRLNQFLQTDFLSQQPYQKVLRIYARDSKGNIRSVVNSYHSNGNPKQMLEVLNARAMGTYKEWHPNGNLAVSAYVIGGTPDLTSSAQSTWLYDGLSTAWDEDNHLIAEIYYSQGCLEGYATYYHPCGQIWKKIPHCKGKISGVMEVYRDSGEILQQATYLDGSKNGPSIRYWTPEQMASCEEYCAGRLESGQYYNKAGEPVSQVRQGCGYKAIFGKDGITALQEYKQGILEGEVKVFGPQSRLKKIYHVKNGLKHGEEIEYFDFPRINPEDPEHFVLQPRLSLYWYEGAIQGISRTWYANGNQESQREWAKNAKNGVSTAWYEDGNLMLIEEYEQDKLVRGDYFKKGERIPVSQVAQGKGVATIFDAEGHLVHKINYLNGKPDE